MVSFSSSNQSEKIDNPHLTFGFERLILVNALGTVFCFCFYENMMLDRFNNCFLHGLTSMLVKIENQNQLAWEPCIFDHFNNCFLHGLTSMLVIIANHNQLSWEPFWTRSCCCDIWSSEQHTTSSPKEIFCLRVRVRCTKCVSCANIVLKRKHVHKDARNKIRSSTYSVYAMRSVSMSRNDGRIPLDTIPFILVNGLAALVGQ